MTRQTARQWVEFALIIQTQSKPGILGHNTAAANIAEELIDYASRLQKYAEVDCNTGLNDKQRKQVEKLRSKVKTIVETLGWSVNRFNTNPRGFAVYLNLPDGRYNSCGGRESGYGI